MIAHFRFGGITGGLVHNSYAAATRKVNMTVYWQVYLTVELAVNDATEAARANRRHHDHTAAFIDKVRGDP